MISLFSVLGVPDNATDVQIASAYFSLVQELQGCGSSKGSRAHEQAQKCLEAIEKAHKTLSTPSLRRLYIEQRAQFLKGEKGGDTHPRLGQLCVTSGMISMEQLREAVEEQVRTGMPLGEVLQSKKFISAAELDGLLLGQEMIDIPSAVAEPVAVRLISLGLITEDMGLIAQMEHRAQALPIRDIVARHGWIEPEILSIVA